MLSCVNSCPCNSRLVVNFTEISQIYVWKIQICSGKSWLGLFTFNIVHTLRSLDTFFIFNKACIYTAKRTGKYIVHTCQSTDNTITNIDELVSIHFPQIPVVKILSILCKVWTFSHLSTTSSPYWKNDKGIEPATSQSFTLDQHSKNTGSALVHQYFHCLQ